MTDFKIQPKIFNYLGMDIFDDVLTRITNQDNLTGCYDSHYCNDCFNEIMSFGTVVRICNDLCCTVFFLPKKGTWAEL